MSYALCSSCGLDSEAPSSLKNTSETVILTVPKFRGLPKVDRIRGILKWESATVEFLCKIDVISQGLTDQWCRCNRQSALITWGPPTCRWPRLLWRGVAVRQTQSDSTHLGLSLYGTSTAHATTFHAASSLVHSRRSAGDCSSPKFSRLADK